MTEVSSKESELQAMRALIERYVKPEIGFESEPGTKIEVPYYFDGAGAHPFPVAIFDAYRDRPKRRTGTAKLTTMNSFIDHANRFKDGNSALFASDDRSAPTITAVLDYHEAADGDAGLPRFGQHRGSFAFPLSDEWKAWKAVDKKPMSMADFAYFLESRALDVLNLIASEDELPERLGAFVATFDGRGGIASRERLVELSRGLHVYESAVLTQSVRLKSGEGELSFAVEHKDQDGKPLKVPGLFLIAIPIFKGEGFFRLAVRLNYRKSSEGVVFICEMLEADRAFDTQFYESCERARISTELPLFFGAPE